MASTLAGPIESPLVATSYAAYQRRDQQNEMPKALSAKVTGVIRLAPSVPFLDELDSVARRDT